MISPAATFPGLSDLPGGRYFFRTIPSYGQQGSALGPVISTGGPKKVAVVLAVALLALSPAKIRYGSRS